MHVIYLARCSPIRQFSRSCAGYHAPKSAVCARESSLGVQVFVLIASKHLILDTYGDDPTLAASSNILYDNYFAANITTKTATYGLRISASCASFLPVGFAVFGSFSKELRALLFDRFTRTIFKRERTKLFLAADLFLASGSITSTYGLQCVCQCLLCRSLL
jgi:hypothetical protein